MAWRPSAPSGWFLQAPAGSQSAIGASLDDDGGSNSGSAYVFVRSAGVWTDQQKLTKHPGHGIETVARLPGPQIENHDDDTWRDEGKRESDKGNNLN